MASPCIRGNIGDRLLGTIGVIDWGTVRFGDGRGDAPGVHRYSKLCGNLKRQLLQALFLWRFYGNDGW